MYDVAVVDAGFADADEYFERSAGLSIDYQQEMQ